MPRKEANQEFAEISLEAETLAAQAIATTLRDFGQPISEIRAMLREANAPVSSDVIEVTGVTLSERMIEGVTCMVIDPPVPRGNREIIYLFGGGFSVGSPFEDLPISAKLAEKTGARVIAPHYPLAPENPFPAALNVCEDVISTLLNENPGACLCGESAGGNLALATVHRLKARGERLPRALALMSPWVDIKNLGDSGVARRDPFLRASEIDVFRSMYIPENADQTSPDLSPIYGPFDDQFPQYL
ncbi:alpha/beta hydrolase fold domain-containing protein [Roseovarius phycicola]|uniref:Alpha/beta hydrolase fold domain-containing protein n=1 Tax=Roseovarius phycicola TaxID=3080976 RepID=A0ABZ2HPV8_9RHOB